MSQGLLIGDYSYIGTERQSNNFRVVIQRFIIVLVVFILSLAVIDIQYRSGNSGLNKNVLKLEEEQDEGGNTTVSPLELNEPVPELSGSNNYTDEEGILDFSAAVDEIKRSIDTIWRYWEISKYPNAIKTMHIPETSWNIQKRKFIKLILSHIEEKKNKSFVVGFSGSSVTAGHDNFFHEAYPSVFKSVLEPVFEALNVRLLVRIISLSITCHE